MAFSFDFSSLFYMSLFLNRCVGSYEEKNPKKPIVLSGKGTNGLGGILPLLESDVVAYALLRVVSKSLNRLPLLEVLDRHKT